MKRTQTAAPWRATVVAALVIASLVTGSMSASPVSPETGRTPPGIRADWLDLDLASRPAGPRDVLSGISYEEARAHAGDADTFEPGGIVDIGFVPHPADPDVDDAPPVALPPGTADGAAIAREHNGSLFAHRRSALVARLSPPIPTANGANAANGASTAGTADTDAPRSAGAIPARTAAFGTRRPQVIGFLPYWMLNSARIRLDVLTTIAYFGVGVTADGHLRKRDASGNRTIGWSGWTSKRMTSIIRAAHRRNVRVVLTVQGFAWTPQQRDVQRSVLGTHRTRLRLAKEIAAAVRQRGADGVNLDFEPIVAGRSRHFVWFVRALRRELNRYSRGYEITVDTTAYVDNYDVAGLTTRKAADAVVVMGYDYRTAASRPGPVAPLGGRGYDLLDTIRAFRARTSASRIILALPWYGRAWSTIDKNPSLGMTRSRNPVKYGGSVTATYEVARLLARENGRHYLKGEQTAWTSYRRKVCTRRYGCVWTWRTLFFDDSRTLRAKLSVIKRAKLRGTAIWALGYEGSHEALWSVYRRAFPKR